MLPSTTIFVLLLSNDRDTLGPWVNAKWLNAVAVVIVVLLVVLSITLMVSTLFPHVDVVALLEGLSLVAVAALLIGLPLGLRRMAPRPTFHGDRADWRMPRVALLTAQPEHASPPRSARGERDLPRDGRYVVGSENHPVGRGRADENADAVRRPRSTPTTRRSSAPRATARYHDAGVRDGLVTCTDGSFGIDPEGRPDRILVTTERRLAPRERANSFVRPR
jgi:hypothetical protein